MNKPLSDIQSIDDLNIDTLVIEAGDFSYTFSSCKIPPFEGAYAVNTCDNKQYKIDTKWFKDLKEAFDYYFDLTVELTKDIEDLNRIRNMINICYKVGAITQGELVFHYTDEELKEHDELRDKLVKDKIN